MGLLALFRPRFLAGLAGLEAASADARNEIRAVYGGFGVAVSGLLVYAAYVSQIRSGVLVAVAAALLGMALGRLIGLVIERPSQRPLLFFVLECVLAGLLLRGW